MIHYTINAAKQITSPENICISTDDDKIIAVAEETGVAVPFKRPVQLATDKAGTEGVVTHALNYYENMGLFYEVVVLLQCTSPFRRAQHVREALQLFSPDVDMVVSVKETSANPYYVLFEEDENGFLKSTKKANRLSRRQDAPKVYELNGAIYIFKTESLRQYKFIAEFPKTTKYLMNAIDSTDIDTTLDWDFAEFLMEKRKVTVG